MGYKQPSFIDSYNKPWDIESDYFAQHKYLCGVDEVGRGPLAGPVVACAVQVKQPIDLPGVTDSKKLSESMRDKLFGVLTNHQLIDYGIGFVSSQQIDELNILQASLLAFEKAAKSLKNYPTFCLVDGNRKSPYLKCSQLTIVKGDSKSVLIGAASIIAKVTRDRLMQDLGKKYNGYGFEKHKGYPTKEHILAIKKKGPCPEHRMTFRPLRDLDKSSE